MRKNTIKFKTDNFKVLEKIKLLEYRKKNLFVEKQTKK